MSNPQNEDAHVRHIKSLITEHRDFPKQGILFRDIFPVLRDPCAAEMLFTDFTSHLQRCFGTDVDVVVGVDSRGFIFAPILAARLGAAFVPVRKKGKLPGECHNVAYEKEYGTDEFDLQKDAIKAGQKCVIVDDLLATGGTLHAAASLVKHAGAEVLEHLVVVELTCLNGRDKLDDPVYSIVKYDD